VSLASCAFWFSQTSVPALPDHADASLLLAATSSHLFLSVASLSLVVGQVYVPNINNKQAF